MTRFVPALLATVWLSTPVAAQAPPAKPLGTEYAAPNHAVAITVDPNRLAKSAKAVGLPADKLWAQIEPNTKVDPATLERATVLIEPLPGGNVAFMPVGVFRFTDKVDGKTKLTEMLGGALTPATAGGRTYSKGNWKIAGTTVAGFAAADGTVVLGVADMIEGVLTAGGDAKRPLAAALAAADTDHDLVLVVAGKPLRERIAKVAGGGKKPAGMPDPVWAGLEALDTATAAVDLTADTVVRAEFRAADADGAKAVRGMLEFALTAAKAAYPDARKGMEAGLPPDVKGPTLALLDAVVNDHTLATDGATVVMTVPRPKGLAPKK